VAFTTSSSAIVPGRSPGSPARPGADHAIRLRGEYDLSTVAALTETLARATALNEPEIVVDLSRARFLDATTIGIIVGTRNDLQRASRSLRLRSPSPTARRLLELCGLADLIDPAPVDALPLRGAGEPDRWAPVPAGDPIEQLISPSPAPLSTQRPNGDPDSDPRPTRADTELAPAGLAATVAKRRGP